MSRFFTLNKSDVIKGVIVAVIGALLGALQQALSAHGLDFSAYDWNMVLTVSVGAGVSYISKNLFTDSTGAFLGMVKVQ